MIKRLPILLGLFMMIFMQLSYAHESRPAYLQIDQKSVSEFDILWQVPTLKNSALPIMPVFPNQCNNLNEPLIYQDQNAQVARWRIDCGEQGLFGALSINGLENTLADVLLRIHWLEAGTQTQIIKPNDNQFIIKKDPSFVQMLFDYLVLGVEHILVGIDHLLFVFLLLLLISSPRSLITTITGFTVAHSITLALSIFNIVALPQSLIEALIALSILILAVEVIKKHQGKIHLAARAPVIVALVFGLIHGFGFAGVLREIGLPQSDVGVALLMFNLGVELGQILFIGMCLICFYLVNKLARLPVKNLAVWSSYIIGSLSVFWVITRVAAF